MSNLTCLQTEFQDYLLDNNPNFPEKVTGHPDAYYQAYRLRLLEILELDYPKCQILMHEHNFKKACLEYIKQYPSHYFSVSQFGIHFSKFLQETLPYKNAPYLADMAEFEWAISSSLDSADVPFFDINHLKKIPPEHWGDLQFTLHPSVRYKPFHWNVPMLWKNIETDCPQKTASPVSILFWRKNISSLFESLPLIHIVFYNGILNHKTFGELCEDLCDITPEDQFSTIPATAVGILQYWIEQGVISDCVLLQ